MDQAALTTFALGAALKVTFVFAAAALLLAALRRAPASFRHLAGTLTLAGALALPFLGLAVPSYELALLESPVTRATEAAPVASDVAEASRVAEDEEAAPAASREHAARVEQFGYGVAVEAEEPLAPQPARIPWTVLALTVWAAGAAILLARLGIGIIRMRRMLAESEPADGQIQEIAREAAASLGISGRAPVRVSDGTRVAITAGLRKPVLVLPKDAARWSPERTRVVLMHELAHVARRDWAAFIATEIAVALYWFHPLAWVLAGQARRDGERAADDLVLGAGTKPSVYAGHLLAIVRALKADPAQEPLPAMGAARPSQFESRLRALLSGAVSHRALTGSQARIAAVTLTLAIATIAALEPWGKTLDAALPRPEGGVELAALDRPDGVVSSVLADIKEAASSCKSKKAKDAAAETVSAEAVPPAWNEDDANAEPNEAYQASEEPRLVYAIDPNPTPATGFVQASRKRSKHSKGDDSAYDRGMQLHRDGDYDEAIAQFRISMDSGYKKGASAYNIACGYALKGDRDQAFAWLKKAAQMGFEVYPFAKNDDDFDDIHDDPRWRELPRLASQWEAEADRARGEEALRRYADLIANPATTGEELYDIGMELHKADRYDDAAKAWQAAAAKHYRPGTSHYNTACAYSLSGDMDRSIQYLRKSIEEGFSNVDAIARKDEDLDRVRSDARFPAIVQMAKKLELAPWGGKYKGKTFKWDGDGNEGWGESVKEYEAFAHANPQIGRAWFNLGFAQLKTGDARDAIAAFHKALELNHRVPTTMYNLACAYAQDNQKDQAFNFLFKSMDAGFDSHGMLRSDEDLDNLRGDPRYREALKRAKNRELTEVEDD